MFTMQPYVDTNITLIKIIQNIILDGLTARISAKLRKDVLMKITCNKLYCRL